MEDRWASFSLACEQASAHQPTQLNKKRQSAPKCGKNWKNMERLEKHPKAHSLRQVCHKSEIQWIFNDEQSLQRALQDESAPSFASCSSKSSTSWPSFRPLIATIFHHMLPSMGQKMAPNSNHKITCHFSRASFLFFLIGSCPPIVSLYKHSIRRLLSPSFTDRCGACRHPVALGEKFLYNPWVG